MQHCPVCIHLSCNEALFVVKNKAKDVTWTLFIYTFASFQVVCMCFPCIRACLYTATCALRKQWNYSLFFGFFRRGNVIFHGI